MIRTADLPPVKVREHEITRTLNEERAQVAVDALKSNFRLMAGYATKYYDVGQNEYVVCIWNSSASYTPKELKLWLSGYLSAKFGE